jgi:hypothetical protein
MFNVHDNKFSAFFASSEDSKRFPGENPDEI